MGEAQILKVDGEIKEGFFVLMKLFYLNSAVVSVMSQTERAEAAIHTI